MTTFRIDQRKIAWIGGLSFSLLLLLTGCQPQLVAMLDATTLEQNADQTAMNAATIYPFKDVTEQAGIQARHRGKWLDYATGPYQNGYLAMGAAWADFDNDGWQDLFVTGNLEPNLLYHNQGDGTFQVAAQSTQLSLPDLPSGGAVWADFDNDGWHDLYVLNLGQNRLYRNIDGTQFEDITDLAGVGDTGKASSAAWGDYDQDGWLDLYMTNWVCFPDCSPLDTSLSQDVLYHNNGDGTFSDVSHLLAYEQLLGSGFAASFADYDNDGDLDIYVVNDKVSNRIGNVLWRNNGPGCGGWCWADVSSESGSKAIVHGMGLATGDYNNDGDLDFYFSNMVAPMVLLDNQGDGTFRDTTSQAGVGYASGLTVGWGTAFFDYDNDGWLDLYQAATSISDVYGKTGMMFAYPDQLYRNLNGTLFEGVTMVDPTSNVKRPGMGFSVADYDNDGQIDFLVGNWNEGYRLYHNQGRHLALANWLTLDLVGGDQVNRNAIGARVYLTTSDGQTQMREVQSGSSLGANNDLRLHFGLGQATIDQMEIIWPDGQKEIYEAVQPNQIWQVRQK